MTLKQLNEHFYVPKYKHEGEYLIHSKEVGNSRMVHKYLCPAVKVGTRFQVRGAAKPTSDIDVFKKQVKDYLKTLKYNSEYYFPLWRDGYRTTLMVHDYMAEIGFVFIRDNHYEFKRDSVYGYKATKIDISFWGLDVWGEIKKTVKIILHTGQWTWVESEVKRDFESIRTGIDTLLKPLLITEGVQNLQISDLLTVGKTEIIEKEFMGLSRDKKQQMKEKLLQLAETL